MLDRLSTYLRHSVRFPRIWNDTLPGPGLLLADLEHRNGFCVSGEHAHGRHHDVLAVHVVQEEVQKPTLTSSPIKPPPEAAIAR